MWFFFHTAAIHIETNLAEAPPMIEVTVPPQQLTGKAVSVVPVHESGVEGANVSLVAVQMGALPQYWASVSPELINFSSHS